MRRSRTRVFCSIGWRRGNGRRSGIASGHWPTPDHSICEERSRDMKLRRLSPTRSYEFATPWYVSAILVGGLPYASGRGAHSIRRLLWFVTHLRVCRCSGGEERNFPIEDAWRKDLVGVLPDDGVAFARNIFERRAIEDVDQTATVTDEARALQQASRDRHGRAAHAEHLPEKFLGQRDRIAVDAIVRLQQPAAKPSLERMERIARDRLLDLGQQQIVVAHDEVANGRALVGSRTKMGSREPRGRAR